MRKKPEAETDQDRSLREAAEARRRHEGASAEARALDDAVRQSIRLHGA